MKPALLLLVLAAACKTDGDSGDFPINPGGGNGGNGSGSMLDAGILDGLTDGGAMLDGRVCVQRDLRDRTSCAATGYAGLLVTVGTEQGLTRDDGSFTVARPVGSNLVWRVSGLAIVSSVVPFSTDAILPAVDVDDYADLVAATGGLGIADGQGSVVARVVQGNAPLANALVDLGVAQTAVTYYDSNAPLAWDQDATGGFGVGWIPGEVAGAYTLTVTPAVGSSTSAPVAIEAQAITFVTVVVP